MKGSEATRCLTKKQDERSNCATKPSQDDPQPVLSSRLKEASVMLDLFERLGTPIIGVTITDEAVAFKPDHAFKDLRAELLARTGSDRADWWRDGERSVRR